MVYKKKYNPLSGSLQYIIYDYKGEDLHAIQVLDYYYNKALSENINIYRSFGFDKLGFIAQTVIKEHSRCKDWLMSSEDTIEIMINYIWHLHLPTKHVYHPQPKLSWNSVNKCKFIQKAGWAEYILPPFTQKVYKLHLMTSLYNIYHKKPLSNYKKLYETFAAHFDKIKP